MFVPVPKSSPFPEIDFASKCIQAPVTDTVTEVLYPLSNANTNSMVETLAKTRLFVGEECRGTESHIVLLTANQATETGIME
jgi:hypothetical protein